MAKNRYVNTHFWGDNYISNLDPSEKLLFLYFLTNSFTNISGVYEINMKQISMDTGFDNAMVKKVIDRFSRDNKIHYFDGYIIIMNFHRHQNQKSGKIVSGIKNTLDVLPDKIKYFISDKLKGIDTLSHFNSNLNPTKSNSNSIQSNNNPKSGTDGFLKNEDQEPLPNPPLENKGRELPTEKSVEDTPLDRWLGFTAEEIEAEKAGKKITPPQPLHGGQASPQGRETAADQKLTDVSQKLNKFWSLYNKREGKIEVIRETFIQNIRTERDYQDLIKATRNYNEATADRELRYLMYPVNFLKKYRDFVDVG